MTAPRIRNPHSLTPPPLDPSFVPSQAQRPNRVAYYYDPDVGNYVYYLGHPMKPHRIRMAHNLIVNYGLCDDPDLYDEGMALAGPSSRRNGKAAGEGGGGGMDWEVEREHRPALRGSRGKGMQVFRPRRAGKGEMTRFHSDEYIDLLEKVTPETVEAMTGGGVRCLIGEDCPAFEGLFEFCSISAGGSIAAAERLNSGAADIAINWAGGLHHAKKSDASGFCYVNDIVLGILELLRVHPRVLYIDVDVHHGDGVEEAFYTTDRVMTCSFHRFGEFFPGTGDVRDIGMKRGKGYAVNVPLRDGITDDSFHSIFKPIIGRIMEVFRPGAVVLQMGADSLSGDKLGGFNLTLQGHGECAAYLKTFGVPVMMLGGGGYTTKNVARAWTNETAVMCGRTLSEDLPYNQYMEYYGPRYKLEVLANNTDDHNPPEFLESIKRQVFENLRDLVHVPSVQISQVPTKSVGEALGMTSAVRMGVGVDDEDDVDIRIRELIKKRNNPSCATDSEDSDDDLEPRDTTRKGYINGSGGRKTLPAAASKRAGAGGRKDPLGDDPCGPANGDSTSVSSTGAAAKRKKRTFFKSSGFALPFPNGESLGLQGLKKKDVVDEIKMGSNGYTNGRTGAGVGIGAGMGMGQGQDVGGGFSRAASPASVM